MKPLLITMLGDIIILYSLVLNSGCKGHYFGHDDLEVTFDIYM